MIIQYVILFFIITKSNLITKQAICGSEPHPVRFRAKKYKVQEKSFNLTEFRNMMSHLPEHVSEEEITEMFSFADKNNDGKIGWEEFMVCYRIIINIFIRCKIYNVSVSMLCYKVMVTPVRMQESGELNRKMENTSSKENDILEKLLDTTNTDTTAEKDKEEDLEFDPSKITGSEKNSLSPTAPIPSDHP